MNAQLRPVPTRQLPQAIESEQYLLGALMQFPDALARIDLEPDDFHDRSHARIFAAICELEADGKPYDAVVLGDWLAQRGEASRVDNGAYLVELAQMAFSAASVPHHAATIRERSAMRRAIDIGAALVEACYAPNGETPEAILDSAVRDLMALSKTRQNCELTLAQAVKLAWRDAEDAHAHKGQVRGVVTGYGRMDARLGGWHKGDLVFIGARPSMGKTAIMVNFALNAAEAGHEVGIISGEQSGMQVGQRSIAMESHAPAERLRNGHIEDGDWPLLTAGMGRLLQRKVRLYDRSAPTLDEICRVARRWKQEHGMAVLFIDYLQRITVPKAENRIEEVSEVARGLKTLARDLDIPVVALAQVKAEVDKRAGDKRPNLGDIANSDEATREADQIAFLYRDEVYNDQSPHSGIAELNLEKNRHGPTGKFLLKFHAETMWFTDLARGEDV